MEKSKRLIALDVFRGLTIALMILVNTPGNKRTTYSMLQHSRWNGCTPTDLVFPFFLFIVGAAMWYSYKKYDFILNKGLALKIIKRAVSLYCIGFLLNVCSSFKLDFQNIRIMGILARIAIGYGIASFIVLSVNVKWIKGITGGILLLYWAILLIFGGEAPFSLEGNFVRIIDAAVLGSNHLPVLKGIRFDQTGLFATFPSIANILLGFLAGKALDTYEVKSDAVKRLIIFGIIGIIVALLWNIVMPINKLLWTSSFALYTSGFASLSLGILYWITDIKGITKWTKPFQVFGLNSIFIYVFSELLAIVFLINIFHFSGGETASVNKWLYTSIFLPVAGAYNGSLLYAITFTCICWFVGWILFYKKIFIKL
jgi:predicted acyltransferase